VPSLSQSQCRAYLAALPELLAKGYVPVPLKASTKRAFHREWTETYCEGPFPTPEILVERLHQYVLAGNEVANPAYSTRDGTHWEVGIVARNGVAFIDVDDPGEVTAIEAITGLNQQTTTVKFGQKGVTYFFRLPQLPDGLNARSYNQRVRNKVDLLTWHAQTVVPPSIHTKTGQPYRWGPLGLLPADQLPEVSSDRLHALLVRYGRKPKPAAHQARATRATTAECDDVEPDVSLDPKIAKALQGKVDTILKAMRQQSSARLIARNRDGSEWGLSIHTDEWRCLVPAIVDHAGGNWKAVEPFLDALSRGTGLPDAERTKVKAVYDRPRNRSKLAGIKDPDTFARESQRKPRTRRTLEALYRGARHALGHSPEARKEKAQAAAKDIAAGEVDIEELATRTYLAIEARTHASKMRELALLLLAAVKANMGVNAIGPQQRDELTRRLKIAPGELARMLCRLDERGLFVIKGGKGIGRTTIVGLNVELVENKEPEWQPEADEETFPREAMARVLPHLAQAEDADLPLILVEHGLLPYEVAEVLEHPDWPARIRHHVVKQEQRLAIELGYLVRRVRDADTIRLTADAKFWHELPDNPAPEALLSRALEEAWFAYEAGRQFWAERARQDGKPGETPPSKKIGLYRNALAKIMVPLDLLGDGFDASPLRRGQGQVLAGPLAQVSQAPEELAIPTVEAPFVLRELIDPLPGGHTFVLPSAYAPRTPVITPGLMTPGM
jgi:hypothetical protein